MPKVAWYAYDINVDKVDALYFSPIPLFLILYMAFRYGRNVEEATFSIGSHSLPYLGNPMDWPPEEVVGNVQRMMTFASEMLVDRFKQENLVLPVLCNNMVSLR